MPWGKSWGAGVLLGGWGGCFLEPLQQGLCTEVSKWAGSSREAGAGGADGQEAAAGAEGPTCSLPAAWGAVSPGDLGARVPWRLGGGRLTWPREGTACCVPASRKYSAWGASDLSVLLHPPSLPAAVDPEDPRHGGDTCHTSDLGRNKVPATPKAK